MPENIYSIVMLFFCSVVMALLAFCSLSLLKNSRRRSAETSNHSEKEYLLQMATRWRTYMIVDASAAGIMFIAAILAVLKEMHLL